MVKVILIAVTREHGMQSVEFIAGDQSQVDAMYKSVTDNMKLAGLNGGISLHYHNKVK